MVCGAGKGLADYGAITRTLDKIMEDMAQFSDKRPIILSGEAVGEGHQ